MSVSIHHIEKLREREWTSAYNREKPDPTGTASQRKRYETICQLGGFYGRSLLEVGCSEGEFLAFLFEKHLVPSYTGLDANAEAVQRAHMRFYDRVGPLCRFETGDVMKYNPAKPFEYVVVTELFSGQPQIAIQDLPAVMERLFSWCTVGVAINFPNQEAGHSPALPTADAVHVLSTALNLTPAVRLDHNTLPNDFTLFLYKAPSWEDHRNGSRGGRS